MIFSRLGPRTIHDYIELLKKFEYDPKKSVWNAITLYTKSSKGSGERNTGPLQRGQGISSRIRWDLSRKIGRSDGLTMPSICSQVVACEV